MTGRRLKRETPLLRTVAEMRDGYDPRGVATHEEKDCAADPKN
jgi:hypothetical protein